MAPLEIEAAVRLHLEHDLAVEREAPVDEIAWILGFTPSKTVRDHLDAVVARLIAGGVLVPHRGGLALVPDAPWATAPPESKAFRTA